MCILTQSPCCCMAQQSEKYNFCQTPMSQKPPPISQALDKENTTNTTPHACYIQSRLERGVALFFRSWVAAPRTWHVRGKSPWLSYKIQGLKLEWDMTPSQKTQLTAGSVHLVSTTLDSMGWSSLQEKYLILFFVFTLNFWFCKFRNAKTLRNHLQLWRNFTCSFIS